MQCCGCRCWWCCAVDANGNLSMGGGWSSVACVGEGFRRGAPFRPKRSRPCYSKPVAGFAMLRSLAITISCIPTSPISPRGARSPGYTGWRLDRFRKLPMQDWPITRVYGRRASKVSLHVWLSKTRVWFPKTLYPAYKYIRFWFSLLTPYILISSTTFYN